MAGSDIGFWLSKKYALLGQQANAASRLSGSQAAHLDAETGELPANARAQRAAQYGQADASLGAGAAQRAHAGLLTVNAGLAPALAGAEVKQRSAAADLSGAQAATEHYGITPNPALTPYVNQRFGGTPGAGAAPPGYNYSTTAGAISPYAMDVGGSGGNPITGNGPGFSGLEIPHFAAGTSDVETTAAAHHEAALAHYGARLGYKSAPPAPAPAGHMLPGHASGTSSVGNNIPNTPAGASFTGANPVHGSDPRDIPGTNFSGGMNVRPPNNMPGYAAGTDDLQGGGMPDVGSFKKGAGKVPGKGDGSKDTVKAALAPGEAVLNKAAAEHLGRDTIDLLNAAGAQKMGLSQQPNVPNAVPDQGAPPGFKKGTSDVPPATTKTGNAAPPAMAAKQGHAPAKAGHAEKAPPAKAAASKADKGVPDKGGLGAGVPGKTAAAPKKAPPAGAKAAPAKTGGGVSPEMVAALANMMGGGGMPAPMGPPAGAPPILPQHPPQMPLR